MIQRDDVDENGAIIEQTGGLTSVEPGSLRYQLPREFRILDPTAEQGIAVIEPRPEWLATISAGFKKTNDRGVTYPQVERNGIIHIPDDKDRERAPELVEALNATGGKSLTIAFCSDDPNEIIVQRFVHYTASSLDIFGDETSLTHVTAVAKNGDKHASLKFERVYAGSREYGELVKQCKAETSVLFALAEWTPEGEPRMVWTGSFGRYRIRFTGRNSIRSILGKIAEVLPLTKGRIAGIPWNLSIGYRDVAGPDPVKGWARHNIPVWQIVLKVPGGIKVDPFKLDRVVRIAANNAQPLRALPAPQYTIEHALLEAPDDPMDMDAIDLGALTNPDPPCDAKHFRDHWHAMVANDPLLSTEAGRHKFVAKFTADRWPDEPRRHVESLELFLLGRPDKDIPPASESDANALMAKGAEVMNELDRQRRAKRYQNGERPSSTTTVEPEPPKEPEPDPGEPMPTPEASPEPEGEPMPIAAELDQPQSPSPAIGPEAQTDVTDEAQMDAALEGSYREVEEASPADDAQKPTLATKKQRQAIEEWVSPGRRATLDMATLTADEADLLLDEYRPRR